ncbi:melanocyte protein PMEL [Discoglossus pictus]
MQGVWCLVVLLALYAETNAQNRSHNRVQQSVQQGQGNKRPPFRSWNSQMYPIWRGRDAQQKDCWKGGQVTFSLANDAPTLTNAKTTFSIQLNFPHNQTVLPNGQVVWSQNRTDNDTWVPSGEPVYPDELTEGADCTFPDGRPFPRGAEKKRSKFVYVWQTLGKYWQVVDGPSSYLTIDTAGVPLGSYNMDVVVYHYRGRQKFIPIGSVSSQFSITNQIPFSVSITQLLDLNLEDQRFIQNRAVSFSVSIHDPSHYLQTADISYSWDFGDQSGTLISRIPEITHTYVSAGVFKPEVVLQAAIPITPCGSTVAVTTAQPVVTTDLSPEPTTEAEGTTDSGAETVPPTGTVAPLPSNTTVPVTAAADNVVTVISLDDENNMDGEPVEPEADATELPVIDEVTSPAAGDEGEAVTSATVTQEEAVTSVTETIEEDTVTAIIEVTEEDIVTALTEVTEIETVTVVVTEEASPITVTEVITEPIAASEAQTVSGTEGLEELIIAKRQAPEDPLVGCLLYRYGSFSTNLDIVQGIESVQIVQVAPILPAAGLENVVDLTVTCQGSIPSQVCTTISDMDCATPQQTICNPVAPSSDCQLVLRQVFNESGTYCVNVSLADDVSLAIASAQVSVSAGSSSPNGLAVTVGVLLVAVAVVIVAYTYRRVKTYTPLRGERTSINWFPERPSLRRFFQNALGHPIGGENSPLLDGRVV